MRRRYLLIIKIDECETLKVGSLGKIKFDNGYYVYVGSGGLNTLKRIKRHFSRKKRLKWHVDYLTIKYHPNKAYIVTDEKVDESTLSNLLKDKYTYIQGFGSSDTKDISHLFGIGEEESCIYKIRDYLESNSISLIEYNIYK